MEAARVRAAEVLLDRGWGRAAIAEATDKATGKVDWGGVTNMLGPSTTQARQLWRTGRSSRSPWRSCRTRRSCAGAACRDGEALKGGPRWPEETPGQRNSPPSAPVTLCGSLFRAGGPIHCCEACQYRIPTHIGSGAEHREAYFVECPLCGGRIHWELMRLSNSPVGPDGYPLYPEL
jgi:hypothetical protein